MLNSIRLSLKNSLVYGLGNIAVKVIGFVLIPLYTHPKYFSVDDFGIIGLLDITGLVIIAVISSSLPQSLLRWYWDKDHRNNQKGIFFMLFTTQIAISVIFCLLFLPVTNQISTLIFKNLDWSLALRLVILSSALQAINNIINMLIRIQSRSVLYTFTNLFKLLIVLILTIYLIIFRKMGVTGIYLAQVIGNSVFILILAGYSIKNSKPSFNVATLKAMSLYSYPLVLASFAGALLNVIDRYALNSMSLLKFVAIYTLAFKISSVLKLVFVESFKMEVSPIIIKKIDSPDNKRFYSKILLYSSYVIMFAIIALSLFSLEIIKVMAKSPELWQAYIVVPVLSLSVFFVNMREVTSSGLYIAKKTKILGVVVVISTVLNLMLNILLIPLWNIMGAALATLLSQLFYWFACYFFAQKAFFIPYESRKIFIMVVCGAALSFVSLLLNDMDLIPRLLIKTGCLVIFPFILYIFNFYETAELMAIKGFVIKWSNPGKLRDNLKSLKDIREDT
jgi:O-antigen/teichoic acid export membrane protein